MNLNRYYSGLTNGFWSVVSNWDNWQTLNFPDYNDTVFANNRNVTIDIPITANILTTAAGLSSSGNVISAGGTFQITVNTGMTIVTNISAGTTACLTTTHNDGNVVLIGNISGGTVTPAHGVTHSGLGRLSISGTVNGGRFATVYGVNITNTGGLNSTYCPSVYITGNTIGGSNATTTPAIFAGTNIAYVEINGNMSAGTLYPSVQMTNQMSLLVVKGDIVSNRNIIPFYGFNIKCSPSNQQNYIVQDTSVTSADTTFSTSAYTYGIPNTSDVRSGVKYGYLSGLTGTMVIPPFSAVSVGISVDDGTGTGGVNYGTAITGIRDIGNMLAGYIG